eukprot:scaffold6934_cov100-Cylindrotheca_fusiformis.AAC.4
MDDTVLPRDLSHKETADRLDRMVTQALLAAEKKVAKPVKPPWSEEELHIASASFKLWKTALTSRLNHY